MIPSITRELKDGNLERPSGDQKLNRRILIIGTAEDGPVYKSVNVSSISHAQEVFGRLGQGSLVRSINEAIASQAGSTGIPQISAVRVGEKYANKAFLDLEVSSVDVLKLEALYPGDIYNDIAIMQDSYNNIKIYNPKTETWSVFSYDASASNSAVDVHNVSELADAINADPNLNDILMAESVEKELFYEIEIADADTTVIESSDDNSTVIILSGLVTADFLVGNRYSDGGVNDDLSADVDKTLTAVSMMYAISDSGIKEYQISGLTSLTTAQKPLDGKGDARFETILNATIASGTFSELADAQTGAVGAEAYLRHRNAYLGKIELAVDATEAVLTVDAPWGIAHEGDTWAAPDDLPIVEAVRSDISTGPELLECVAPEAAEGDVAEGWAFSTLRPFKLEFRAPGAGANDWSEVSYVFADDIVLTWIAGVLTITISNTNGIVDQLIALNGGDLRVSFDSIVGEMTEVTTLTSLAGNAVFSEYFVRGNEIVLGAPTPANLVFRHATIQYYELGSTLEIVDASEPKVKLVGAGIQPGPAGGAISSNDVIIGFKYNVSPDMFTLTAAKAFANGTNGIGLTANQLYEELAEAYNRLDDQKFDIVSVPGAYLDSTKTGYNEITGLPQEVNAEFHILMNNFLSSYNGEAVGVIGFKPLDGTGINKTITRLDVASRVEKITEVDLTDPLRAANFLVPFESIHMLAVDVEPIFLAAGSPYTTSGEAWVSGHLSTLAPNESIYLDVIPGAAGLRYAFSEKLKSGKSQLDALSDARVIASVLTAGGVKLTDGPLLAPAGSDYERLTTYWIVRKAMEITRAVAGDYLGRAASLEILQALESRLKTDLALMVPDHLSAFNLKIKSSPKQRVLGQLEILLVLVPVFEIRHISVPVILKADESGIVQLS